jgi:Domain of unknown function (DUF6438)
MQIRFLLGALLLFGSGLPAHAQQLPFSLLPSDIEIQMTVGGGGGCAGRCIHYRVTITGDGTVRYEDSASPPLPGRTRKVPIEDVVTLTNEFVRARFFEASSRYEGDRFYRLQDGKLELLGHAAADGTTWDLSLRLGSAQKSVHLYIDIPDYLARLRDLVDRMAGTTAWQQR